MRSFPRNGRLIRGQVPVGGGAPSGGGGFPYFDLATLNFDGWWSGSAAIPWTPTASAGASGTNGNLIVSAGTPTAGDPLNGYDGAIVNGTTDTLVTATSSTSFITQAAGTIVCLCKADTLDADDPNFYEEAMLAGDAGGYTGLVYTASGVRAGVFNAGSSKQTAYISKPAGSLVLAVARWDSSFVRCRVGSVDATPVAAGAAAGFGSFVLVGGNYSGGGRFDGTIYEVMFKKTAMSDSDLDNIKTGLEYKYQTSLG